jgi:hypothetical protein
MEDLMRIHSGLVIGLVAVLAGNLLSQGKSDTKSESGFFIQAEVPPPLPAGEGPVFFEQEVEAGHPGDVTFTFVASEMGFGEKAVKGSPYSAEAATETVQVLSDGNRITRKNTTQVYRDSEGRTRRDQSLGTIGPWVAAGEPRQTVFINDPVAGVHYVLDPRERTAAKLPFPRFDNAKGGTAPTRKLLGNRIAGVEGVGVRKVEAVLQTDEAQKESLGKQVIEGIEAEGTRSTVTIPAGKIGNELPIQIVSERWYSPELQVVVMSKHSDPRFGETVYKLTNINQSEPAHSLFELPPDYTLKDEPQFIRRPPIKKGSDDAK